MPEERVGERPRAGPPNLQQQLHHAQAVVFHGVDEWRAAALNVLGQGGKVFKSLQGLPRQPAVRRRTARSGVAIRLETPEHHPPTHAALSRASPAPFDSAPLGPTPGPRSRAHHRVDVRAALQQEQHGFLTLGVHGHVQSSEP